MNSAASESLNSRQEILKHEGRMKRMKFLIVAQVLLVSALVGCGTQEMPDSNSKSDDATVEKKPTHTKEYYDALLLETFKNLPSEHANSASATLALDGLPNIPEELMNLPGLEKIAGLAQLLLDLGNGNILDIGTLLGKIEVLFPGGLGELLGDVTKLSAIATIGGLTGLPQVITVLAIASGVINMPKNSSNGIGGLGDLIDLITGGGGLGGLLDLINIGGLKDLLDLFQGVINGTISKDSVPGLDKIAFVPDVDELLNLKFDNAEDLIETLKKHAQVINGNFSGEIQEQLLTLLKVAYAQAYQKL